MSFLITTLQAVCAVDLALVSFVPRARTRNRPTALGWAMVFCGSFGYVTTAALNEHMAQVTQDQLHVQIDRLLQTISGLAVQIPPPSNSSPVPKPSEQIRIEDPLEGASVGDRESVRGITSNPRDKLWVVVHPEETGAYWVQSRVSVNSDGSWRVGVYLGRAGKIDLGKRFEIMAVANPRMPLDEGMVLPAWPEGEANSDVRLVTRK